MIHRFVTISKKMYNDAGYTMPNIVFWNLRATLGAGVPVTVDTNGVAMISGFSSDLLTLFLDGDELKPDITMMKAIQHYQVIVDEHERNAPFTINDEE